jgi:hypothetical protein
MVVVAAAVWAAAPGGFWGAGQGIGDHILRTWEVPKIRSEFGDGSEMSLLSGRPGF